MLNFTSTKQRHVLENMGFTGGLFAVKTRVLQYEAEERLGKDLEARRSHGGALVVLTQYLWILANYIAIHFLHG